MERLPGHILEGNMFYWLSLKRTEEGWKAGYVYDNIEALIWETGDTLVEALEALAVYAKVEKVI